MRVCIIGVGLIGGSMAVRLRENAFATSIIGVEPNSDHAKIALKEGIVDRVLTLEEGIRHSDLLILAVAPDTTLKVLPQLLALIHHQIIIEVCSIKKDICTLIASHKKRKNVVLTHPMAGIEYSGPQAAMPGLFEGKAVVLVEEEKSSRKAVQVTLALFKSLKMRVIYMHAIEHDVHVAYVSHISHVSSMALALTVLEKEKDKKNIFDLASGGFNSTVRLAKSSSEMWTPIFAKNAGNILVVLEEYIKQLSKFKKSMEHQNAAAIDTLIHKANKITKIIDQ